MTGELGRLGASDGATVTVVVEGLRALLVINALAAPIYGRWATNDTPPAPSATAWDVAIPGEGYMVLPVPGDATRTLRLVVDYAGAVPAGDVQAVVIGTDCSWSPSVGPLA